MANLDHYFFLKKQYKKFNLLRTKFLYYFFISIFYIEGRMETDGLKAYLEAVTDSFGSQIDFAQLVKLYGSATGEQNEKNIVLLNVQAQKNMLSPTILTQNLFLLLT